MLIVTRTLQGLSLETVGVESEVILPSDSGEREIHIGMKVAEGLGDVCDLFSFSFFSRGGLTRVGHNSINLRKLLRFILVSL